VHVTFLALVILFALATPDPSVATVAASIGWLVAIFTCVVVHEFAHSLVARTRGADVHEIMLFPLGGVSKLERMPEVPTDELAIAIAGPAASVGLAGLAGLTAVAFGNQLLPPDLLAPGWPARLMWLNLVLAGFNLVPAFPLDGGRVLRALLERRWDRERATHVAARIGHGFALALVALGVLFNPWFVLIGVFVYLGASAEEAATVIHIRLQGLTVGDAVRRMPSRPVDPSSVEMLTVHDRLDEDLLALLGEHHGGLPVVEDQRVVGELHLEDVVELLDRTRGRKPR